MARVAGWKANWYITGWKSINKQKTGGNTKF